MFLQILAPTDQSFDVPDEFAPFLLQESGKNNKKRLLLIGDATMKNLRSSSITWLVDGTCKLSPEIFYQSYANHAELKGFTLLFVYLLQTNKSEKT